VDVILSVVEESGGAGVSCNSNRVTPTVPWGQRHSERVEESGGAGISCNSNRPTPIKPWGRCHSEHHQKPGDGVILSAVEESGGTGILYKIMHSKPPARIAHPLFQHPSNQ